MDVQVIIDYIPVALAATAALLAGGWAFFKFVAKLTKTTADDEFIAEHGEKIEDALDKMDGE
jgi:hypothetical protein